MMFTEKTSMDLVEACIEALSLFDNHPELYEMVGTYQVLNNALRQAQLELFVGKDKKSLTNVLIPVELPILVN
jgi:hypothetical protein